MELVYKYQNINDLNTFIKSKLNKDLDARIVPNGEYRDAVNVQVSRSESSSVGSLENVLGNNPATLSDGTAVDFSVIAGLATGTLTTMTPFQALHLLQAHFP